MGRLKAALASAHWRLRIRRRRLLNELIVRYGAGEHVLIFVFPDAEQKEGDYRGSRPKLGATRGFGLRFPAKELRGNQESNHGTAEHRGQVQTKVRNAGMIDHGLLQAADQEGCRQEI